MGSAFGPAPLVVDESGRVRPASSCLLVYDGECELCRRSVEWIRRRDPAGRVELLPYQEPASRARFGGLPEEAFEGALQLLLPDGARVEGARAVEEVLRQLPAGRGSHLIFALPGARRLAGRLYGWIARNRRRFRCPVHCPRSPVRQRDADRTPEHPDRASEIDTPTRPRKV